MQEKHVNFILPEMTKINSHNDETYHHAIMTERRVQRLQEAQKKAQHKLEHRLQDSQQMSRKVLQEFDDVVDWTIENGQEELVLLMNRLSDLLFCERTCRQNVMYAWYHHRDSDKAVVQAQHEIQKQYARRMAQLEYNDDYLQEQLEKGESFTQEQLDFFQKEEYHAQKEYAHNYERLHSSLGYTLIQRETTYGGMQRSLTSLDDIWQKIENALQEMYAHMKATYGEVGYRETERICHVVEQEIQTIDAASKTWKRLMQINHELQDAWKEKRKTDRDDLHWMEEIYATTQAELPKFQREF